MDESERKHQRELLEMLRRRKRLLTLQAARYGPRVDPSVLLEIEDIEQQIAALEHETSAAAPLGAPSEAVAPPTDPDAIYDVFISYSRKDAEQVRALVRQLVADGFKVWLDEEQIGGGDALREVMARGIQQSRHTICCLSPAYFQSKWGSFESALSQANDPNNRSRRLIPVVIAPVTIPPEYAWIYCPNLASPATWASEYRKLVKGLRSEPA